MNETTIIYLDYSSIKCFFRVLKRIISDYRKTRSDMAPGCVESIDFKCVGNLALSRLNLNENTMICNWLSIQSKILFRI